MIKSFFVSYILCFCLGYHLLAQHPEAKRANIWYFGNGAGLDFSSGSPVAITNGALHSKEGCATICDINGNLLFYTDGDTVWDRTHNPMPNGTGLLGCGNYNNSSVQGVLIVPLPLNNDLYYIFTNDCLENNGFGGFNYSIVDITSNFGLGDVISKNNLLFSPSSEMVSATKHKNGYDYWIITHEPYNSNFRVYLLSNSGISSHNNINVGINYPEYGSIEISPNSKLIAVASDNIEQRTILYRFDNNLGNIEYYTSLPTFGGERWVSFSPDGSKVFYTESGNIIYNFDLCFSDTVDIKNSFNIIDISMSNSDYVSLQLSNDLKLYVAGAYTDSISVIDNPNNPLNIQRNILSLSGKLSSENLPNFMDYIFNQQSPCVDTTELPIDTVTQNVLIIPNVFTPNGDGVNDVFRIKIQGFESITWKIYNRWGSELNAGNLIIEKHEYIDLWNGRTNAGLMAPSGTYYYIINLTIKGGELETKKGFIQILH